MRSCLEEESPFNFQIILGELQLGSYWRQIGFFPLGFFATWSYFSDNTCSGCFIGTDYFNLSNHPMFPFYRWGNWGKQVNKLSQGHTASKCQMRLNQTLVPESTYPSEFFEWQVTEAQLKLVRQKWGFVSSQNQSLKRTGRERLSETMETENLTAVRMLHFWSQGVPSSWLLSQGWSLFS